MLTAAAIANLLAALAVLPCAAWVLSVATHRADLLPRSLAAKLLALLGLFMVGKVTRAYGLGVETHPGIEVAVGASSAALLGAIAARLWARRRAWTHLPTAADLDAARARAEQLAAALAVRDGLEGATARARAELDRVLGAPAAWHAQALAAGWSPPGGPRA